MRVHAGACAGRGREKGTMKAEGKVTGGRRGDLDLQIHAAYLPVVVKHPDAQLALPVVPQYRRLVPAERRRRRRCRVATRRVGGFRRWRSGCELGRFERPDHRLIPLWCGCRLRRRPPFLADIAEGGQGSGGTVRVGLVVVIMS